MNEEAKRSMIEWQDKLDKVTKDSEERISELQHKLAKVSHVKYRISWFMDYNSPELFIFNLGPSCLGHSDKAEIRSKKWRFEL